MVHEYQMEKERAEHRLCLADCNDGADRTDVFLHKGCRHHGHDQDHCAICQQNSITQQIHNDQECSACHKNIAYERYPLLEVVYASRIFRHSINPRAP